MFIDSEDSGAWVILKLCDFKFKIVPIVALNACLPDKKPTGQEALTDAVIVRLKNLPPEGLGRSAVWEDAGKAIIEVLPARSAEIFMGPKIKINMSCPKILMPDHAVEGHFEPKVCSRAVDASPGQRILDLKNYGVYPMNIFYLKTFDSEYTNNRGHKISPFVGYLDNNHCITKELLLPLSLRENRFFPSVRLRLKPQD
jgi:hypothetical protein